MVLYTISQKLHSNTFFSQIREFTHLFSQNDQAKEFSQFSEKKALRLANLRAELVLGQVVTVESDRAFAWSGIKLDYV